MIHFPYDFGIPDENEGRPEEFKASKTPRHQAVESESSFDSGYFSPPVSTRAAQTFQNTSTPHTSSQQSPAKGVQTFCFRGLTEDPDLTSILPSVLDDWDKNFIDNFQENLFGFDNIDEIGFIDGIVKSPLKSQSPSKSSNVFSPLKMRQLSPRKFQYSPDRHGQLSPLMKGQTSYLEKQNVIHQKTGFSPRASASQWYCDKDGYTFGSPVKAVSGVTDKDASLPVDPVKQVSFHVRAEDNVSSVFQRNTYFQMDEPNVNVTRPMKVLQTNDNFTNIVPFVKVSAGFGEPPPPKKVLKMEPKRPLAQQNVERPVCASKQKLQMARANFTRILDRAVQTASSRYPIMNKSNKYPQLSKALTKKPSTAEISSLPNVADSEAAEPLPFERYRDTAAGSRYEVKHKSDCKVVIRKKNK